MLELIKTYLGICLFHPDWLGYYPLDSSMIDPLYRDLYQKILMHYLAGEKDIQKALIISKEYSASKLDELISMGGVVTGSQMKSLVEKIKQLHLEKQISIWASDIPKKIQNSQFNINQSLSEMIQFSQQGITDSFIPLKTAAAKWYGNLLDGVNELPVIQTGENILDKSWLLTKGGLHIIAGRPAMGKTFLCVWLICQFLNQDIPVLFFSLEMTKEQIFSRLFNTFRGMSGLSFPDTMEKYGGKPLWLYDSSNLTVENLLAMAKMANAANHVEIIVIDYVQLLRTSERFQNRVDMLGHITWTLKYLAKQLNCVIIIAAQLNRGSETRKDNRPFLADIRESGSLENDADSVLMLYRPEYYAIQRGEIIKQEDKDIVELVLAKQRHAPQMNITCKWYKDINSWMFKEETRNNSITYKENNPQAFSESLWEKEDL